MVHGITVIIPTRDRPRDLRRCLRGLAHNDTRRLHEVIVVDDGSRVPVALVDMVPGLPVRILRNATPITAMPSRNLAAATVRSSIIAFLDDDAMPTPDWLSVIGRELTPDRGGITGRVLRFDRGLLSAARQARFDLRYAKLEAGSPASFFAGGNSAVWTALFHAVGGFTSSAIGGDNSLVHAIKSLGAAVHFAPGLIIQHRNGKGLWRAITDAFGSGRAHPKRLNLVETLREASPANPMVAGRGPVVFTVNWLLHATHLAGRFDYAGAPTGERT